MSGHSVPYNLRTNKHVERHLFLDCLEFVRHWNEPTEYAYVSMGGPFLEDFKAVNDRFGIEQMVSLEILPIVQKRQLFNAPIGFIDCRVQSSLEFINDFQQFVDVHAERRLIVWLDYAIADQRNNQLNEFSTLCQKLSAGDVVKITMNANPITVTQRSNHGTVDNTEYAFIWSQRVAKDIPDFIPLKNIELKDSTEAGFASYLASAVGVAATRALEKSEFNARPLSACRYNDSSHQMLTVTCLIVDKKLKRRIKNDKPFQVWPFRSESWGEVKHINLPNLSVKERLHINNVMKSCNDVGGVSNDLGFQLDENIGESMKLLKCYLEHYRRYPVFSKIT